MHTVKTYYIGEEDEYSEVIFLDNATLNVISTGLTLEAAADLCNKLNGGTTVQQLNLDGLANLGLASVLGELGELIAEANKRIREENQNGR